MHWTHQCVCIWFAKLVFYNETQNNIAHSREKKKLETSRERWPIIVHTKLREVHSLMLERYIKLDHHFPCLIELFVFKRLHLDTTKQRHWGRGEERERKHKKRAFRYHRGWFCCFFSSLLCYSRRLLLLLLLIRLFGIRECRLASINPWYLIAATTI